MSYLLFFVVLKLVAVGGRDIRDWSGELGKYILCSCVQYLPQGRRFGLALTSRVLRYIYLSVNKLYERGKK